MQLFPRICASTSLKMLLRPSWVAPYTWRMTEIVLYCLDCDLFKACLTWTLNSLFLQMASRRRLANRPLHEALGTGLASQVHTIWHLVEMRKVPLVLHQVKQESVIDLTLGNLVHHVNFVVVLPFDLLVDPN